MSLAEGIEAMELAGTTDLRAKQVLSLILNVVGTPSDPQQASAVSTLQSWLAAGAHRADRDQNGQYEHAAAVQIMDAWWPRLLEAEFEPEMGADFFDAVHGVLSFDNEPNNHGDHLGSAYQDGWWGYVSKDLRRCWASCVRRLLAHVLRERLVDRLPQRAAPGALRRAGGAGDDALRRGPGRPACSVWTPAPPARATSGASTPCGSGRSAPSPSARSTGSTGRPSSRPSRSRDTGRAATSGPRARRRCACRWCRPSRDAPRPNRQHGPPLAFGSCNPPEQRSDYLTIGAPDANGKLANSIGHVSFSAFVGNPSTPADEADVNVTLSLTDVRKRSDLSDYTGQLEVNSLVRITDRDNEEAAGGGSDPATVSDFPLSVPATCAATADTTIGGDCSVSTTLDALVPSTIKEGDRASWQLGAVQVFDGGADGLLSTSPNTLFARQGVFVP